MRGVRRVLLVILLVALALVLAYVAFWRSRSVAAFGPALALCPGPDQFGYTCADGDVYSYVDATNDTFLYLDDGVLPVDLPFPFTFYDQIYDAVNISVNGNLQFTTDAANFSNDCLNEAPAPRLGALIAPYWDDLDLRLEGFIETEIIGEAPDRVFVIEWDDVPHYGDETGATVTFEVQLFEGSNDIVFLYPDVDGPNGKANGASATIGIQSEALGVTLQFSCNQPTVANFSGLQLPFPLEPNTDVATAALPNLPGPAAATAAKGDVLVLMAALEGAGAQALPGLRLNWLQGTPARDTSWLWLDMTGDGADELVYLWRGPDGRPLLSEIAVLTPGPAGYEPLFFDRLTRRDTPVGSLSLDEAVDITGDGRRDLLVTTADGRLFMLTYAEASGVVSQLVPESCSGSLGAIELNGDGRLSIVRDQCEGVTGRVVYVWAQGRFIRR